MNKSYVEYNMGKNFLNNLVYMRRNGILRDKNNSTCKVYLQFTPHFFHLVNSHGNLLDSFDVSYLKEHEISIDNHKLGYTVSCNNDFTSLQKDLEEEKRHMTTGKKEVLDHDIGFFLTKEECKTILDEMGDISLIRYIVLSGKEVVNGIKNVLSNYSFAIKPFLSNCNIPLKSKIIKLENVEFLLQMGLHLTMGLVRNPPDSFSGISIVADAPECNDIMLNVVRPGVLRQYYGLNIGIEKNNIIERIAYRSQVSIKSEGSDPYKLIIKPFNSDLCAMASYLTNFLRHNQMKLDLQLADLSKEFNSCTMLLYHSLNGIKNESSMGWHTDSKYSLAGNFLLKSNGQSINTPVVIFTLCGSRVLHWRKRISSKNAKGNRIWQVDEMPIQKMVFEEGDLCVINPIDEKPHKDEVTSQEIHFQHGKTKVKGDTISIAMVFRVSPHKCNCDIRNNKVILDKAILDDIREKESKGKVNQERREATYKVFDTKAYHEKLLQHFKKILNKKS